MDVFADLCQDLVVVDGILRALPRSTLTLQIPVRRGEEISGVRLPLDAVDVRTGEWRMTRGGRSMDELVDALGRGVIVYRRCRQRATMIELLNQPRLRLGQAATAMHMSDSTFRRRAHGWFDTSARSIARTLRLWRWVEESRGSSAADAASRAGFFDQSHAHRDLRELTGYVPNVLLGLDVTD